jgi:hypothetical protein
MNVAGKPPAVSLIVQEKMFPSTRRAETDIFGIKYTRRFNRLII